MGGGAVELDKEEKDTTLQVEGLKGEQQLQ